MKIADILLWATQISIAYFIPAVHFKVSRSNSEYYFLLKYWRVSVLCFYCHISSLGCQLAAVIKTPVGVNKQITSYKKVTITLGLNTLNTRKSKKLALLEYYYNTLLPGDIEQFKSWTVIDQVTKYYLYLPSLQRGEVHLHAENDCL